ncbi:hypothetical protein [Pseudoalteromonas sp. Z1A8]|uniref:hypothetical protein n=1 Tax=Pseudoalteromonas sp. Z1A8 TaxID=2686354 RepID=UPI00140E803A|nr:hypothetical protein [Pseudoalteromonas sp. Z1A8]
MQKSNFKINDKLFFIFLFFQIFSLLYYFSVNIKNIGEGAILNQVLIGYFLCSSLIFIYILIKSRLFFNFNSFCLFVFLIWLTFKIVFDRQDLVYLKEHLLGTGGGIFFFLALGFSLSFSFAELLRRASSKPKFVVSFLLFLFILIIAAYVDIFSALISRKIEDRFIISGLNNMYQRPGDFSTVLFIIFTSITFIINLICFYIFNFRAVRLVVNYIYLFMALMVAFIAQIMGSNNSFVMVAGISFIFYLVKGFLCTQQLKESFTKDNNIPFHFLIIRKFFKSLAKFTFFSVIFVSLVIALSGFDYTKSRFFSSNNKSSIESRVEIVRNNFLIQLSDSPLIGNYNVDVETTGEGTYTHSVLLFALTHTGIIGFILIFTLLFGVLKGLIKKDTKLYINQVFILERPLCIFYFFILLYVILIANLATALLWSVLWFSIGFLTFTIRFKNSEDS